MIVDTSALIAVLTREPDCEPVEQALRGGGGVLPAPAELEFLIVARNRFRLGEEAVEMLTYLAAIGLESIVFTPEHARVAAAAHSRYGKGQGGPLNILDLMVYAVAQVRAEPLLFVGRDFAATDVRIHSASQTRPPAAPH